MEQYQDYEKKLNEIRAIPDRLVKSPNYPVDVFIQEARNLHQWIQNDRDKLIAAGIPEKLIDDLPVCANALLVAQGYWIEEYQRRSEAQALWNEKASEAFDLRDRLVHACRYAYRNNPEILGWVSYIAEDNGNVDMLQDLHNISLLGKKNPEPLKSIGFDMTQLDKAAQLAVELGGVLAKANGDTQSDQEAKITRDKAYTYLKEAVDEIRDCGKYLFWRNEERLKGYSSAYRREMYRKAKETKENEEETGEVAEP
jgi:hypothetical protein